jgi:hypothetical protein
MRNGTALLFVRALSFAPCPSGRGRRGREGTSIIAQVLSNKKAQNKCKGAGLKEVNM